MHTRTVTVLTAIAVALGVAELGSSVIIWREAYPDSLPAAAVVFAALFLTGAWLLRSSRVVAGTVLVGVLCLFELVSFPGWTRHGALDWVYQIGCAALSLAGLAFAVAVLVNRRARSVTV
jgi:hypothetical protein